MKIEIEIPDDVAHLLKERYPDLPQAILEFLALEAYRARKLSGGKVKEMLGYGTIMQVHAFLKEHGVYLNYSIDDLEQDIRTSEQSEAQRRLSNSSAA